MAPLEVTPGPRVGDCSGQNRRHLAALPSGHRVPMRVQEHRPVSAAAQTGPRTARNIGWIFTTWEFDMSAGKHGNKEAKKPKRAPTPTPGGGQTPLPPPVALAQSGKKK